MNYKTVDPMTAVTEEVFTELAAELAYTPLPTANSGPRLAGAAEFLLMTLADDHYHFKHIHTRNYLLLSREGLGLIVPNSGEPFKRGLFDWPF